MKMQHQVSGVLMGLLAAFGASAQIAAPGANCQLDPLRGQVCGLYHDISGLAEAGTPRRDFSSGTGYELGSSYLYSDGVASGSAFTYASASAFGFATFGQLRSISGVNSGTGGEFLGPNAVATVNTTVGFNDSLRVTSASRNGQSGTVVARLEVSGGLTADSLGFAARSSAFVQVNAWSGGGPSFSQQLSSEGGVSSVSGNPIPGVILFNIPVVFRADAWQPFSVQLRTAALGSSSNVFANTLAAKALADYGSTLNWGGVVEVLDANGQAISDGSMGSASGFDYSRSFVSQVPEPAAWLLLVPGLLVMGLRRLRALDARA